MLMPSPATTLRMNGWPISVGYTASEYNDDNWCDVEQAVAEGAAWMRAMSETGVRVVPGQPGPETLTICGMDNAQVAKLQMPPHLSFGIGAKLMDAAGNVCAVLASKANTRPSGMQKSSYQVFAGKPQFAGQAPDAHGRYLWAICTRSAMTYTCKITNGAGADLFVLKYPGRRGSSHANHKVTLTTADGKGVMLVGPSDENPKRHHIEVAAGGDPIFYICIMYACNLAFDELVAMNTHEEGPGGSDD